MNHDAKHTGGIFRRRPSSSSTTGSRLSIQSGRSGSVSCPTSPRHTKHLPAIPASISSANFNDVLTSTTSRFNDGPRLHRSPSAASTYNYRQQSSAGLNSYTGWISCGLFICEMYQLNQFLSRSTISALLSSYIPRGLVQHRSSIHRLCDLFGKNKQLKHRIATVSCLPLIFTLITTLIAQASTTSIRIEKYF